MSEWWGAPVPGGTGPSRWWYGLAGGVALVTVLATGLVAYGRADDAIRRVTGYPALEELTTTISIGELGEYAVYCQWVDPPPAGTSFTEPMVRVKGSRGEVPVHVSNVSYGMDGPEARAIATFEVTEPGDFLVTTSRTEGRLTFGKSLPGRPLYGMGRPLMASLAVVLACAAAALLVARLRHDHRHPDLL